MSYSEVYWATQIKKKTSRKTDVFLTETECDWIWSFEALKLKTSDKAIELQGVSLLTLFEADDDTGTHFKL